MGEQNLIEAAVDGAPHAGTFLVSMCGPQLLAYAHSIAPDLSDTDRETICEVALEKAMAKIDQYDPAKGSLVGWLRGFVRFTVMDWRRSDAYPPPRQIDDLPLQTPPLLKEPEHPHPLTDELKAAIAELSEADQLYVYLRYWEQLPTKDIAQRLNKSDAAVRKQLSRIVSRLRATMTN